MNEAIRANGATSLPEYGQRLLPVELDRIAKVNPDRAYCSRPRCPTDLSLGFEDISYNRVANAVTRTAHWLRQELGKPRGFDTIAYLAVPDIRNMLLALAVSKVGFKIPSLSQLLAEDAVPSYPFGKSFSEAKDDPVLVLHTSGSTGFPKPIIWTHGFFAAADSMMHKKPPPGRQSAVALASNTRLINTMPGFHAAGIGIMTYFAIWIGCCSVLPPQSSRPLDAVMVANILKHANASSLIVVPSILEDMRKDPVLSGNLRHVKNVIWSGGPLPKETGEVLKHTAHLTTYIGSTELTMIPHWTVNDPNDWQYLEVDECFNIAFCQHTDDLYEAVVVRSKMHELYQPVWHIFPDLQEYHTKDLYSKHPTKPGLWMYRGRIDDIIVFVNGEKFNAVTFEDRVSSHAALNSVLVTGQGCFQAALLVEPKQALRSTAQRAHLLEEIWPLIEKANENGPAHCRVSKAHVLFTKPEKPMLRASKGTVQRRLTLNAYAEEVDSLYADAESIKGGEMLPPVPGLEAGALESLIIRLVNGNSTNITQTKSEDDLFAQRGMDSLQVLQLLRDLASHGYGAISPSLVYNNPTVSRLAGAIQDHHNASPQGITRSLRVKTKEMQDLLNEVSAQIDGVVIERPDTILLTGSSGALGSYLLDSLIKRPQVKKIFCLNRTTSAEQQVDINTSRGLETDFDSRGVEFLRGSVTAPLFGLAESTFQRLGQRVTRIIHCAWPVDFNLSLPSFSPQLHGVRALIDFAASHESPKSILFISSIASVGNWSAPEPVPEIPLSDFSLPSSTGYAESKFLAEQLLLGSSSLVDVSICRIGQIAGPVFSDKGCWKKNEWFPSLVASSKYLSLLPESLGSAMMEIDWIPIDVLSTIVAELALLPRKNSARVFHAVNPRTCDWKKALLPAIHDFLGPEKTKIVPFSKWVEVLRHSATETFEKQDFEKNPAIKLLDFFEALPNTRVPRLSTVETRECSQGLREMKAVGVEDMKRWMRQWELV
ncbi:MAG: hypothetical protein Q9222_002244 [Ikaeria aurantiellina]